MLLVSFVNHLGITQRLEKEREVGRAQPVDVIQGDRQRSKLLFQGREVQLQSRLLSWKQRPLC